MPFLSNLIGFGTARKIPHLILRNLNSISLVLFYIDSLHPKWEFSHIGLPVKKIYDLRMHFLDLIRNEKTANWSLQCQKVLQKRHAPLCQHLLKKGQYELSCRSTTNSSLQMFFFFISQARLPLSLEVIFGHTYWEVMLSNT